jgi:UDP-N-acetyl-D-mannosaminuronate dehydrogenase
LIGIEPTTIGILMENTFWLFNIAMETEACIKLINTRIIWDLVEVGESNPWYLCK